MDAFSAVMKDEGWMSKWRTINYQSVILFYLQRGFWIYVHFIKKDPKLIFERRRRRRRRRRTWNYTSANVNYSYIFTTFFIIIWRLCRFQYLPNYMATHSAQWYQTMMKSRIPKCVERLEWQCEYVGATRSL